MEAEFDMGLLYETVEQVQWNGAGTGTPIRYDTIVMNYLRCVHEALQLPWTDELEERVAAFIRSKQTDLIEELRRETARHPAAEVPSLLELLRRRTSEGR
ncbi:hypothetical protein MO973_22790 [Paenibacillus sp. TRM 82003]|nr:hypothetical protein [Paenibacillus sp. TRM 82003]